MKTCLILAICLLPIMGLSAPASSTAEASAITKFINDHPSDKVRDIYLERKGFVLKNVLSLVGLIDKVRQDQLDRLKDTMKNLEADKNQAAAQKLGELLQKIIQEIDAENNPIKSNLQKICQEMLKDLTDAGLFN